MSIDINYKNVMTLYACRTIILLCMPCMLFFHNVCTCRKVHATVNCSNIKTPIINDDLSHRLSSDMIASLTLNRKRFFVLFINYVTNKFYIENLSPLNPIIAKAPVQNR